jgi:RNA polymerase sigma factor (sigma-70 family)
MPRPFTIVSRAPSASSTEHEEAFVRSYAALHAVARRLAGGDADLAGDLVQDAYVQFVVTRPDLASIERLDAYLAVLVKNIHLSRLRRRSHQRDLHVPLEEYDSAESALRAAQPEQRLIARDALGHLCEHVAAVKDRSRPASILALRFFHGLYPSDIGRIVRATPAAVHEWLRQARQDARRALSGDQGRGQRGGLCEVQWPAAGQNDPAAVVSALREALFTTGAPPCVAPHVRTWYARPARAEAPPLDSRTLSHVAGCRRCFEAVCAVAGLPPSDDHRSWPPGDRPRQRLRGTKRVRDLLEHRPRQLMVCINGHHVGVVCVESARTELQWTVRLDEPVAFAELHSEQGLRMALLHVELPPAGSVVQSVSVALSDDRVLRLSLDFSGVHPAVAVDYVDPSLSSSTAVVAAGPAAPAAEDAPAGECDAPSHSWWTRLSGAWRLAHRLVPVAGAVAVAAAGWWVWSHRPAMPEPSAVIDRAVSSEAEALPAAGAVHRTLRFESRRRGAGEAVFSHRIEAWTRPDQGMRAVRVFDGANHMIAGRWIGDGRDQSVALGVLDDVWSADLSAATFRNRHLQLGQCTTEADAERYTLACGPLAATSLFQALAPAVHAQTMPGPTTVLRAELSLRRSDLHAVRLVLTVPGPAADPGDRIVTLDERALRHVPVSEIPAGVFAPETREAPAAAPSAVVPGRRAVPATPSLEVRVLELIDRIASGEYLSVDRVDATRLSLSGLVSTAERKRSLLDAVADLDAPGAVTTEVRTFAEAARGDRRAAAGRSGSPPRVRLFESGLTTAPIDEYMQARVAPGLDAVAIVRELAPRVLASSERLRRHGLALQALADRFDDRAIADLDDAGARAWRTLLGRHVGECLGAIETLDTMLAPYFDLDDSMPLPAPDALLAASHRLSNEATIVVDALTAAFLASDTAATAEASGARSVLDVRHHLHRARFDARLIRDLAAP